MTYQLAWYETGRILEVNLLTPVTLDGLERLNDDMLRYLDEAAQPLHVLQHIDHRPSHTPAPSNLLSLPNLVSIAGYLSHRNMGWLILYDTANSTTEMMVSIVAQMSGVKYRHFKNRDAALDFLRDVS